MQQGYLSTYRR